MLLDSPSIRKLREQLNNLSPFHLSIGLGCISVAVMFIGTCAAYSDGTPLPTPRPAPPSAEKEVVTNHRFKETFYHAVIDDDCAKYGIPKATLETMKAVYPYRAEFDGSQRLSVGRSLDTKSLSIKAIKRKLWIGEEGQSLRAGHWVLRITNRTDKHLAYRVTTKATGSCSGKGALPHNAIALAPRETIERVECLLRKTGLRVERVEVMEISPLGYRYVSRLDPERVHYDPRTSAGHDYANLAPCRMIPWRRIRDDIESKDAHWFDVVDFYARHNCDEYIYFSGYHRPDRPIEHLPVRQSQDQ